jgi:hypothetical protein
LNADQAIARICKGLAAEVAARGLAGNALRIGVMALRRNHLGPQGASGFGAACRRDLDCLLGLGRRFRPLDRLHDAPDVFASQ